MTTVNVSSVSNTVVVTENGSSTVVTVPVTSTVTATTAGPQGATGATGATGAGVAAGGTAGQVLAKIDSTDYNTQWVNQSGGGGIAAVTGTSPISVSTTSGTATVSIATAGTATVGAVQLTNSATSTSTTTAATPNSLKLLVDNLYKSWNFPDNAIETFPRVGPATISSTASSGLVRIALFVPLKDMTVGTATINVGAAGTAITLARMGLFTWDQTGGTATLVARTANDTTIGGTAAVLQSRAFDTTGGYPATYDLVAGTTYGFGYIAVGTNVNSMTGINVTASFVNINVKRCLQKSSQTDLSTVGSWTDSGQIIWGRFS